MHILISVPHGRRSPDRSDHWFDHAAFFFADTLSHLLQREEVNHKVLIPKITRDKVDMNRAESRDTLYRKQLDREMSEADILVDVHSTHEPEREGRVYECFFLTMGDTKFSDYACEFLRRDGIECGVFQAYRGDDIIKQAIYKYGIERVLLIEIGEQTSRRTQRKIARLLTDFLINI